MRAKPTDDSLKLPVFNTKNPLIPKGAFPDSFQDLYDRIARLPAIPTAEVRRETSFARLMLLEEIEDFYFPAVRDLRAAIKVLRMLHKGLNDRIPNAEYWRAHNKEVAHLVLPSNTRPPPPRCKSARSVGIIGVSAGGKSTSIENLLSSIPQLREHEQQPNSLLPRFQILWMILTCPGNRSIGAFVEDFFTQVDALTGSNHAHAYRNANQDELITGMGKIARAHFLGILVIDEIQCAAGKDKRSDRSLMKTFVRITSLGVPVVFVGTPKSQNILNAEFAHARRMIGPQWLPYSPDDADWNNYLNALTRYCYANTVTTLDPLAKNGMPIPGGLRHTLTDCSQGIPGLAKALWTMTQERAIMRSKIDKKEAITPPLIQQTYDEDMRTVHPAVNALKEKWGLDVYDDLLPEKLPQPKAWENDDTLQQVVKDCYQDSLVRATRRLAREEAVEMFGSSK